MTETKAEVTCCVGLRAVLDAPANPRTKSVGLERAVGLRGGQTAMIYRLPRLPRGAAPVSPEFKDASYILARFCPFCGREVGAS